MKNRREYVINHFLSVIISGKVTKAVDVVWKMTKG
jgi:hypothetical protein